MPPIILATTHRSFLARHTACGITNPSIEGLLFRRDAEQFIDEIFKRTQPKILGFAHPRLGINLWIGDRHNELHVVSVETVITLFEPHLIAMRITEVVEPCSLVKSIGLDYKRVSFPFAHRPTEHSR